MIDAIGAAGATLLLIVGLPVLAALITLAILLLAEKAS